MELCRELEAMPFLFPKFENWIDAKDVRRLMIGKTESGDYMPSATGVRLILTNPVYLGIWIPQNGGVIEHNHEAIVDEGLFIYAFNRLSSYDLQGNRQKPEAVTRNGKVEALLRKVIKAQRGNTVRTSTTNLGHGIYKILDDAKLSTKSLFSIMVSIVDEMFLKRFFLRIQSLPYLCQGWEDVIEKKQLARNMQAQIIKKSIQEVDDKMERLAELLADNETSLPDSLKRRYIE